MKNEIDLGDDLEFTVKYKGQAYKLREPTVAEIETLQSDEKKDMVSFLATLGMPADVTKNLGISKANKVVEGMLELVGKKK